MSGGRAFVLDLDTEIVNTEMVDVLAVPADQRDNLRSLVSSFHVETGSEVADSLLKNWDTEVTRFSLIMPRDYARVLAAIEKANREGLPVDEYIMEVAANG
jgi:glutamate synthase (NADPH/NADH) large chain